MTEPMKIVANSSSAISPEHLARLLQISQRLSSTLRLDELLSLVMDVATELTHTETASILLVDRSTGQLHFAASTRGAVADRLRAGRGIDNPIIAADAQRMQR